MFFVFWRENKTKSGIGVCVSQPVPDIDHIGYATKGGVWYVFNNGFTFDVLLDRDAGVWLDGDDDGKCDDWDDEGEFEWHKVGEVSGTREKWVCWTTSLGDKRKIAVPGSADQIVPPDAGARVYVAAADGSALKGPLPDGLELAADHSRSSDPPGENEFSLALVISYGKLDYATCGDVGGELNTNIVGTEQLDVESALAPLIGSVEAFQVGGVADAILNNASLRSLSRMYTGQSSRLGAQQQRQLVGNSASPSEIPFELFFVLFNVSRSLWLLSRLA